MKKRIFFFSFSRQVKDEYAKVIIITVFKVKVKGKFVPVLN
jgi:hypothetical protein